VLIRTVLTDYRPEELGGGAMLFHEHMSLASFLVRFRQYAAEAQAVNRPSSGARTILKIAPVAEAPQPGGAKDIHGGTTERLPV
jgi:hypothetical protein